MERAWRTPSLVGLLFSGFALLTGCHPAVDLGSDASTSGTGGGSTTGSSGTTGSGASTGSCSTTSSSTSTGCSSTGSGDAMSDFDVLSACTPKVCDPVSHLLAGPDGGSHEDNVLVGQDKPLGPYLPSEKC